MEFSASIPIYEQVVEEIKRIIMSGELKQGEKLWSAREMALKYQINPNTAARVYKELEALELCFTRRGLGTYITEAPGIVDKLRNERAEQLIRDFVREFKVLGYEKDTLHKLLDEVY